MKHQDLVIRPNKEPKIILKKSHKEQKTPKSNFSLIFF